MTLQIIPGNRNVPIPLCARLCSAVWARLSFGVPIRGYTRGLRSVSVRIGRLRVHFLFVVSAWFRDCVWVVQRC